MTRDAMSSCRLKINRANQHFKELEAEIKTFLAKDPYPIRHEHDPQTNEHIHWVEVREEPPYWWGVLIGDAVYNLRSALDHLAWALAARDSGVPPKGTEFPVFHERDLFYETTKKGDPARGSGLYKIRGIKRRHDRARITTLQPYNAGDAFKGDPLWVLHELCNIDKHRFHNLVGSVVVKSGWSMLIGSEVSIVQSHGNGPFEHGTILLRYFGTPVKMEPDFVFHVALPEGQPMGGVPIIAGLSILGAFVSYHAPRFEHGLLRLGT